MKGTLRKTDAGWVIDYRLRQAEPNSFDYISENSDSKSQEILSRQYTEDVKKYALRNIPLHPDDCWLSTNVDGLKVDFEIVRGEQIMNTDQQQWQEMTGAEKEEYFEHFGKIIKEETWEDIFEKCKYVTDSQSMTRGVIFWLAKHYKVPESK